MRKFLIYTTVCAIALLCAGCMHVERSSGDVPAMFPDYADITIPYNIAPLDFRVDGADAITVKAQGKSVYSYRSRGELMRFPIKAWKRMLDAEKGGRIEVDVTCKVDGEDKPLQHFFWDVSADAIDRYLSYRLIEPAYEVWNTIQIEERDVETFGTRLLGDNEGAGRCCMNCHTSNGDGTSYMHLRGSNGGTILNRNGKIVKLDTKTDSTMGGAVYGDISRDGRYGVFAAANITFAIHSQLGKRMDVFDTASDLLVIDFDNLTVTDSKAVKGAGYQETFPCFSADGRVIFFCRARHLEQPDSTAMLQYDIVAVSFAPETGKVGSQVRMVMSGGRHNVSFSHLKCSPDGRYLMATASQYGTFPVWHPEAELWMIDLSNGQINVMAGTNAWRADTYHSWSSNSRWIVFASKRDDNVYGRPYIAHVDENGKTGKAFVLPQKDPESYRMTLKSFNLPELYRQSEDYGAKEISRYYSSNDVKKVTYKSEY